MNRKLMMIALFFILIMPQAWGATSQYPNPYRQTTWNNLTDSIHTMGKTPSQKKLTLMKLHAQRAAKRMDSINNAARARRKAQMQAWRNNQAMNY